VQPDHGSVWSYWTAGPLWDCLPSRQQAMNMLRAADLPEKRGQLVDQAAALEAMPAYSP
jgi:hypothetical protein